MPLLAFFCLIKGLTLGGHNLNSNLLQTLNTMQYIVTNLLTQKQYERKFNGSHHFYFSDPDAYPKRSQLKEAERLIAKWNTQQPMLWAYKLIKEA